MKKSLLFTLTTSLLISFDTVAQSWSLTGNNNANSSSILGTTNSVPLRLFTKNMVRMTIDTFGFVGIGTIHPVSTLDVHGTQFLNGNLKFGTGNQGIQFANPSSVNKAMMYMFTSGTTNPSRMVLAHSTAYPNYGLQYNDTTDNFHFIGNGTPVLSIDLQNLSVSIFSRLNLGGDVYQDSIRIIHVANSNTAFGSNALQSNTNGSYNTAIGYHSLLNNKLGLFNTAIGYITLLNNTNGDYNVALGNYAMYSNTTAIANTALGYQSLLNNIQASYNTAVGGNSLYSNITGTQNTAIGFDAGNLTTDPSLGTFIGYKTSAGPNLTNVTAIGSNAFVNASNKVVIGNTSVTSIGGYANWTNFSDGRYKKNISENVPGLEFINQLRAVTYTLDVDQIEKRIADIQKNSIVTMKTSSNQNSSIRQIKNPELSEKEIIARQEKAKIKYTGFVAQEVEKAALNIGYDFSGVDAPNSKDGFYGLRYADFVVPLVKAVQQLSKKNDELKNENQELKQRLEKLEAVILGKKTNNPLASTISLDQNIPNPAHASTSIVYNIPSNSTGQLNITDDIGRTVKTIQLNSSGRIDLDLTSFSTGSYTYSLVVNGKVADTKKLIKLE
jgi:hypothetical protein